MGLVFFSSLTWFILLLIPIFWMYSHNEYNEINLIFLFTFHGIIAFFYWIITNRIHNSKKPPLSYRFFDFIIMLCFGPFGFPAILFIKFYMGFESRDSFQKYKDYISVEWNEHTIDESNYHIDLKKQLDKEPVIDTLRYSDMESRRGAAEVLSKMGGSKAILALKALASETDPGIRFIASSKLTTLEAKFLADIEWYTNIIKIAGPEPEILMQYGLLMLEFIESGLVDIDMVSLYSEKIYRTLIIIEDHPQLGEIAKLRIARALRAGKKLEKAISILENIKEEYEKEKNDELAECYFHQRDFKNLKTLINNEKNRDESRDSNVREWIMTQNIQSSEVNNA